MANENETPEPTVRGIELPPVTLPDGTVKTYRIGPFQTGHYGDVELHLNGGDASKLPPAVEEVQEFLNSDEGFLFTFKLQLLDYHKDITDEEVAAVLASMGDLSFREVKLRGIGQS